MHDVQAKSILSAQNGMNLCRGCTHGCIYCDSRSLCYGMDHAFEDVAVKVNAPELLQDALRRKRRPCMIATGSMSDPYMPNEKTLALTRQCLEIIDRFGFGATLITKSDLVLRDLERLRSIQKRSKCVVQMTLTTLDDTLCRLIEPNVCPTSRRVEALLRLREAGIPTVVWFCPLLPFINDTEENVRGILSLCFDAGVSGIITFGMGVTLRDGNREYFYRQLDRSFPGLKARYQKEFGLRYSCQSPDNRPLMAILENECAAHKVPWRAEQVFSYLSTFPEPQLKLF